MYHSIPVAVETLILYFWALGKKLEEVDKVLLLADGILQGHTKFEFAPLTKQRLDERTALLAEIRKSQAGIRVSDAPARKRKGTKSKKKANEPSTFDITVDMINTGMTVEEIAKKRELVAGTIESHLAKAVEEGRVSIFKFMDEGSVMEIINTQRELPEGSTSKELYEKLNGKFGYGQLRAAMAHAKKSAASE